MLFEVNWKNWKRFN